MTVVAVKKKDCGVCDAGKEAWESVNEALWDGHAAAVRNRVHGGRVGAQAAMAAYGHKVDVRTIDRHRSHVEASARVPTERKPQTGREQPLYDTAFESVTDRMAGLGMVAADQIEGRLKAGIMDDKALVATATLGLRAAHNREAIAQKDRTPQINIQAIFATSSGYLRAPEQQVIDVGPTEVDLKAEIETQRLALKDLAAR